MAGCTGASYSCENQEEEKIIGFLQNEGRITPSVRAGGQESEYDYVASILRDLFRKSDI